MALTDRQIDQVVDLLSAGHHFDLVSRDIHKIIIKAEVKNGLYEIEEKDGEIIGFVSGWMVNKKTVLNIKEFGLLGCMQKNIFLEIGPYLYASHSCASANASQFLLLSLIKKLIKKYSPISICAYKTNRSKKALWVKKRIFKCR